MKCTGRMFAMGIAAAWFGTMCAANAGTFTVGNARSGGTGQIIVPVTYATDAGGQGSAMQFDLHYPPQQVRPTAVVTGSAAQSADKGASYNVVRPGVLRVIVAGMNQQPVGNGTVAEVTFEPVETTTDGNVRLTLRDTVVSDGDGNPIASNGVDGSFKLEKTKSTFGHDVFKPVETPDTGRVAADRPAGGLQGKVVIPGVTDTDITGPTGMAVHGTVSRPPEPGEPVAPVPPESRIMVAQAPATPDVPTARTVVGTDEGPSPEPFRSVPTDAQGVEPGSEPAAPAVAPRDESESEDGSGQSPPSSRRGRVRVITLELAVLIVAVGVFLVARKLFKV